MGLDFVLSSKDREDILKFSVTASCKDGTAAGVLALGKPPGQAVFSQKLWPWVSSPLQAQLSACGAEDKLSWSEFWGHHLLAS